MCPFQIHLENHAYRIDGVPDFNERLHMIFQIPMNCQSQVLSAFLTARETSVNSFPSPEKFSFYKDNIESIEWPNPAPEQRICDRFGIHFLH